MVHAAVSDFSFLNSQEGSSMIGNCSYILLSIAYICYYIMYPSAKLLITLICFSLWLVDYQSLVLQLDK